ncbi:MAG: DUF6069 family protein [Acidimicrobiales bacterium]
MTTSASGASVAHPPVVRRAGLTALAAVAVNLVILGIGAAADVDFDVPQFRSDTTMAVNPLAVILSTLVALAAGWALVASARRWGRPSLRAVQVIGAVVAVVSLALPLGVDADASTRLVLAAMHLATGAIFVAGVESVRRDHVGGPAR